MPCFLRDELLAFFVAATDDWHFAVKHLHGLLGGPSVGANFEEILAREKLIERCERLRRMAIDAREKLDAHGAQHRCYDVSETDSLGRREPIWEERVA